MEPERWREIERAYQLAREPAPVGRAAVLEQICGSDKELRQEVESLLSHAEGAEQYLRAAVLKAGAQAPEMGETAGHVMGRYCLLRKIGEGGMGEVWLAEQKEPVRRSVALKLVKAGMNTRAVIARFESERQALALMGHPAIAKVFDAGSTPQGAPYFVMEYVAGIPVTAYCDDNRLSIRQRLELFMRVCEGVQHVHRKTIIHCDLKPSNILVVEMDGRAVPKIIDFGVAKSKRQRPRVAQYFARIRECRVHRRDGRRCAAGLHERTRVVERPAAGARVQGGIVVGIVPGPCGGIVDHCRIGQVEVIASSGPKRPYSGVVQRPAIQVDRAIIEVTDPAVGIGHSRAARIAGRHGTHFAAISPAQQPGDRQCVCPCQNSTPQRHSRAHGAAIRAVQR
jgi:hypothetical protein